MLQYPWIAPQSPQGGRQSFTGLVEVSLPPGENSSERFRFGGEVIAELLDQRFGLAVARLGIKVGDHGQLGEARRGMR